jgi:hypothetical protein
MDTEMFVSALRLHVLPVEDPVRCAAERVVEL